MGSVVVEADSVEETLDAVDRLYTVRHDADASLFELAAHFADLHSADSFPRGRVVLPGMERPVRIGGVGTPSVAELSVAELGARMRMGTWSARRLVADALDVRHRLPLIWARVREREARVGNARLVAAKTRHLTMEAAAYVDAAMVDFVDGSLPWGRFETRLNGKIVAADPVTAAEREGAKVQEQFAKRTRASESGTAGFYIRSSIGVIARLEATIVFVAEALKAFGDRDTVDVRRVKAIVTLCNPTVAVELLTAYAALRARTIDVELPLDDVSAERPVEPADRTAADAADAPGNVGGVEATGRQPDELDRMNAFARKVGFTPTHLPAWLTARAGPSAHSPAPPGRSTVPTFVFDWSRLLPSLTLNLHLSAETLEKGEGGVVRWEGEGPVTEQFVHDHLRPLHYVIQPVIDLAHMAPVDAYEIPDRHRRAVHLRTPADSFPFSSNVSEDVDIDHNEEYGAAPPAAARDAAEKDLKSRLDNYAPLGRFHHRIKTFGHWTLRQPFHGILVWRDPHGQVYLVDHTGTHKVTRPGTTAGATTTCDPDLEVSPTDTVIEVDFGNADRDG